MVRNICWINLVMILVVMFHMGTIKRKEDPILDTQTDPILYKQKQEELKDGPKGAPAPSMKFYGREKFLVEPPMETEEQARLREKIKQREELMTDEDWAAFDQESLDDEWWLEDLADHNGEDIQTTDVRVEDVTLFDLKEEKENGPEVVEEAQDEDFEEEDFDWWLENPA